MNPQIDARRLAQYAIAAIDSITNTNMRPYVRTGGVIPYGEDRGKVNADVYEVSKDAEDSCIDVLLAAYSLGCRIIITYRDGSTLRCTVGRSTGEVKLLLAIKTTRSLGGEAILTGFIDRISLAPRERSKFNVGFPRNGILWERGNGNLWRRV